MLIRKICFDQWKVILYIFTFLKHRKHINYCQTFRFFDEHFWGFNIKIDLRYHNKITIIYYREDRITYTVAFPVSYLGTHQLPKKYFLHMPLGWMDGSRKLNIVILILAIFFFLLVVYWTLNWCYYNYNIRSAWIYFFFSFSIEIILTTVCEGTGELY